MIEREVLIPEEVIKEKVKELGKQITEDYKGKNVLLVGILKGSFIFLADLIREINLEDVEVDFLTLSSYKKGTGTESSRNPKIVADLSIDIQGRHVLIVEDIVDSGWSFSALLAILEARNPASLKTCALLDKSDKREIQVPIHYLGFSIEDRWLEGYGLDTLERYRGLKDITTRKS